jgi:hypothetical protein
VKNLLQYTFLFLSSILFASISLIAQNVGSEFYIEVNKIYLPFDNKGIIADVDFPPNGSQGQFAGSNFLFSSGFWLSGYTNGSLWANGVASAALVADYQPGIVGMDPNDPNASIYRVSINDVPFGLSWQNWIDAVDLGADFYDGDGNGIYNPVDLNGNNQWDPGEDKPDIFLDETYWCVFNDGVPSAQRKWNTVEPQGIEVRQTIFAMNSPGELGNIVFVRYRIKNTGLVADTLEDVYFSMWADGDIGDATDDFYGCDTLRQGIYFYQNTPDTIYVNRFPSFMMDQLTGPYSYIPGVTFKDENGNNIYEDGIDIPLDTAFSFRGPLGIIIYPGAKNLETTSCVVFLNGDPSLKNPDNVNEARNYILGKTRQGNVVDPCTFAYGDVRGGVNCAEVNPYFWCSGDPVTNVGWIFNQHYDVKGAGSTGPFKLIKNQEVEILIGYEIDGGPTSLSGITAVRIISDAVQSFYENNFGYPIVSIEDEQPAFSNFSLEQNFPNPFNPGTKISWQLPVGCHQTIKVFDALGNEVATLVNEYKPAGRYEIEFNASSLPSGVYFYQLKAGDYIDTKKMILLK